MPKKPFMKKYFIILILFFFINSFGQNECTAIIDWQYIGDIEIFEKPNGKIITTVKNDSINEDFLHLTINNQTEEYFYVTISLAINYNEIIGWIKKAEYIGAYKKHEVINMKLILYSENKISNENKIEIENWNPTLLTFEKYSENMVLVSLNQNGKKITGWIEKNELCANSYTTCN
jgi:hypothetical protein